MCSYKEKPFLTPNDEGLMGADDARSIQNAIDAASEAGVNKVVIPRYNKRTDSHMWSISAAIQIPSQMTIILDNCYMQLAEGYIGQMFTNSLSYAEEGTTLNGEQTNINIIGKGLATIDGGLHNGLTERFCAKNPGPHRPWDNLLIYFHNVREFRVEGFRAINQRWWALCFLYCSYGKIANIELGGTGDVPNQDGIDLRCGCHDITIENITGKTGDDTVALTALAGSMETAKKVVGCPPDIYNVIVRNIKSDCFQCCVVRLLNHDGIKLYNILIDNIIDTSVPYSKKRPSCAVRIGEKGTYHKIRMVEPWETTDITVRNVTTRARYGVCINSSLTNAYIENIQVHDDGQYAVGTSPNNGDITTYMKNVMIDGVFYNPDQKSRDGSAELEPSEYVGEVFNFENCAGGDISIKNVFAEKTAHLMTVSGDIEMAIENASVGDLGGELVVKDDAAKITLKNVKVKGELQK